MGTRAAIFRTVGEPLKVVELDVRDPGPHEVVVKMAAVGICGTDLHQVRGDWQRPTPMVLGHVAAGRLDPASLVGAVYSLDAANEAIRASLAGASGRVLVMP